MLELWVRKEEIGAKIRATGLRVMRAKPDVELINRVLSKHTETLKNLRSKFTIIVSLREYVKIHSDIKKMKKILRDTMDFIQIEEATMEVMQQELQEVEKAMERHKNPQNLLIFRPRS